jgi:hypothetical protein
VKRNSGTPGARAANLTADNEVIARLAGGDAGLDRAVAHRTRRVVLASLGVMQDQSEGRRRIRAIAVAAILVVLVCIGPLIWWAADNLIAAGHLGDLACQFSLWVCILCPALVAAVLVAGWMKTRS